MYHSGVGIDSGGNLKGEAWRVQEPSVCSTQFFTKPKTDKKLVKCTNFLKGTSKNGVEEGKTKPFHYLTFNFGVFL